VVVSGALGHGFGAAGIEAFEEFSGHGSADSFALVLEGGAEPVFQRNERFVLAGESFFDEGSLGFSLFGEALEGLLRIGSDELAIVEGYAIDAGGYAEHAAEVVEVHAAARLGGAASGEDEVRVFGFGADEAAGAGLEVAFVGVPQSIGIVDHGIMFTLVAEHVEADSEEGNRSGGSVFDDYGEGQGGFEEVARGSAEKAYKRGFELGGIGSEDGHISDG
jgi:hypothetical protein